MASPVTAMTVRCLLPSDIISSRFIVVGLSGLSRWRSAVNLNGKADGPPGTNVIGQRDRQTDRDAVEAGLAVALDGLAPPPCYLSHANVNFTLVGEGCERTQS